MFPHCTKNDGCIESRVALVKFPTFLKSRMTKVDLGMFLLCLKATSIDNKLPSPAKLLLHNLVEDTRGSYPRIDRKTTGPQIHERSTNEFRMCTKTEGDHVSLKWKQAEIKGKEHNLLAHQNKGSVRCPGTDFLCAFQPVTMIWSIGRIYMLNFFSA